jgi:hypothetical protein
MPRKSKLQSPALSDLERRKEAIAIKIADLKKHIQKQSQVRAGIRARLLGECLMHLAESGEIDAGFLGAMKADLLDRVEGNNKLFEALQGSAFDVTDLLRETSAEVSEIGKSKEYLPAQGPIGGSNL